MSEMKKLRLVPVEVFGTDSCGLCDAVSSWSDCNRAGGKIYRVDEEWSHRLPGETVDVYVNEEDLQFFDKEFGSWEEVNQTIKDRETAAVKRFAEKLKELAGGSDPNAPFSIPLSLVIDRLLKEEQESR